MALSPETFGAAFALVNSTLAGAGALKGEAGKDGKDGKYAYDIARDNGFLGTEQEWLDSLKADDSSIETVVQEEVTKQIETQLQDTIQESVDKAIEDALSDLGEPDSDMNDQIDSWFN